VIRRALPKHHELAFTAAAAFLQCANRALEHGWLLQARHGKSESRGATQRTLPRGTAKRLHRKHAKPRPFGRARSVSVRALKIRGFLGSP